MLTTREYAAKNGMEQYKVAEMVASGRLSGRLVGRTYMIPDPSPELDEDWRRLEAGELVTLNQYASGAGITVSAVKKRIDNGNLPCVRVGATVLVDSSVEYNDGRISSGRYIGWRHNARRRP